MSRQNFFHSPGLVGLALLVFVLPSSAGAQGASATAKPPAEQPAEAPRVVMPELVEFVDAPYPDKAAKEGREGTVLLGLTIGTDGRVTEAEVVEPAGEGFDEAARRAALGFRFRPATSGGERVAVRILYEYKFELQEQAPSSDSPQAPLPTTGNLSLALRIAELDVPLAGVAVSLRSRDGREYQAVTDPQGRVELAGLEAGTYAVEAAPEGYLPLQSYEAVTAGEVTELTFRLSPATEQIVVTVEGERPPREVTRRTLDREQIRRIPGTSGDALLSIQSLPGVARPPGLAGLLIVRGSAPQDTEVFIDGAIAQSIYHFGGLRSIVPTELLDRIDFYPGNFGAKYGRVMGGIIDVALREPDTRCFDRSMRVKQPEEQGCFHGLAQVDLLDGRVLAQGPIAKGWTFAIGGRRSWIDAWIKPVLEQSGAGVTTAPVYYDYQLITEAKPTEDSRLSLRLYGADDRLKLLIDQPFANDPGFGGNLSFGQNFYTFQGLFETRLTRDFELMTSVAAGDSNLNFQVGTFRFDLSVRPIQWRTEFGWRVTEGLKVNAGLDFLLGPGDLFVRAPQPPDPGRPESGPFTSRPPLERDLNFTFFRPAWYTDIEYQPTERLRVVPGLRVDFARDTGRGDLSPRINARYQLVKEGDPSYGPGFQGTALKAGVGYYHQPPQFQETDAVFGTPNLISNESVHYAVGIEQGFTEQLEVSTEGFYKDMRDLVVSVPSDSGPRYDNVGTGSVIGWETLLQYKPGGRFYGWLAYTLSRSMRRDTPDEELRSFQWDQTHNLVLLGNYDMGRGWQVGARFRLISGRLETPVVRPPNLPAVYAADATAYAPLQSELYSQRMPLFHQADLRVEKTWQFEWWRLMAYLDVWNAYNNPAVEGIDYNYNFSKQVFQSGIPILPSFGVRGEF